MPSIRRSLIVYFLGLLGLGFGFVAAITAQITDRTLRARDAAAAEAIDLRAEERIKDERDKLDKDLLAHARIVTRVMHTNSIARTDAELRRYQTSMLFLPVGVGGGGGLNAVVWSAGSYPSRRSLFGPVSWAVARDFFTTMQLTDVSPLPPDDDEHGFEFVQLNLPHGKVWRSPGMGAVVLPFDPKPLDEGPIVDWRFDDVTLAGDVAARRVVMKTPLPMSWWSRIGRPGGSGRPPFASPLPPPPTEPDGGPKMYIHLVRPKTDLDARLAAIHAAAHREKTDLALQTQAQQADLRVWLAVIGGAAFVGTLVGGSVLIGRGLTPIRHLSHAVSQVSEKDFRLPVEPADLSWELLPIHARLTHTLDELRRAFVREKQAVADISHELRTPVASLLATLDVALRKPRSADQYRATLEDCRGIGKALGVLVERVMTLARLDADADQIAPEPTDAAGLAAGCAAIIKPLAESQGLTLSADVSPAEVVTDPHKLREVLMNLLHNAVEYNRPGGTVKLTVRTPPAGGAEIEVRDTGIGMTAETRERIFERFYRADASRHAAGVHAGLGLAIVKGYLDRLGGSVAVDSTPGEGTTFRVTLPATAVGA